MDLASLKRSLGSVEGEQLRAFPTSNLTCCLNDIFKNITHDFFMTNRKILHSLVTFKFWSKVIGEPIFNSQLCDGIYGKFSEFKNSTGKFTALSWSTRVLIDLNEIVFPSNSCWILKIISSTSIFFDAKLNRSHSHAWLG